MTLPSRSSGTEWRVTWIGFRQILAELELLSHGTTQAFNSSGIAAERDPRPAGESHPPHETFLNHYEQARDDSERETVRQAAEDCLMQWRGHLKALPPRPPDIKGDVRKMRGYTPKEIANRLGGIVTQGQIIGWRAEWGVDVSTGYEKRALDDVRFQARRLREQENLSVRQIAGRLGQPKSNVDRWLKEAA